MHQQSTMIRSRLGVLLAQENLKRAESGQQKLTQHQLAEQANIALAVVSGLATNKQQRVDYKTMDRLCRFFNVQPGELFEYIPDEGAGD
jgi:putative transcriptional regulator